MTCPGCGGPLPSDPEPPDGLRQPPPLPPAPLAGDAESPTARATRDPLWRRLSCVALVLLLGCLGLLVFPSLFSRPRQASPQVACHGQLRQIGRAMEMYAGDHGGLLPPYGIWPDATYPYLRAPQLYICPAAPGEPGYAFNHRLGSFPPERVKRPAETYLAWDGGAVVPRTSPLPGATASRHRGGDNFLYADGHVEWVRAGAAAKWGTTNPSATPGESKTR